MMSSPAVRSFVAVALATFAGCTLLQPRPDPSRFFVLTPTSTTTDPASTRLALGLGPIELPAYLRRPQMVTRIGDNEITLSEIHRWGEPLEANFNRVLGDNLSRRLRTDRIVPFPWFDTGTLNYAVRVSVLRFEADNTGTAHLLARWLIAEPTTDKILYSGESDIVQKADDDSVDAAVTALSGTVEKLSEEIAREIDALNTSVRPG